jgi:dTDP-4-amino-4,6-dideoxygalactose transaminase
MQGPSISTLRRRPASSIPPCWQRPSRIAPARSLYGLMNDVAGLRRRLAALRHPDIAIIEDCAQAHGASFGGAMAGTLGDAAAFSFYPTKNLGAFGDAGAVLCQDAKIAERVRELSPIWLEGKISDGDPRWHDGTCIGKSVPSMQAACRMAGASSIVTTKDSSGILRW